MTDPNPGFDPADIRGAASTDPDSDTEHSVGDRGHYIEQLSSRSTRTCPTCPRTIPANEQQCQYCATEGVTEPTAVEAADATDKWIFGRVVLAVVEASNDFHATALGKAALSVASPTAHDARAVDGDVKPIAMFDETPAAQLTKGWPDLPTVVAATDPVGETLLETAVEQTDWDADETPPVLFGADGTGITDRQDYEAIATGMATDERDYWLVPGVVKRYLGREDVEESKQTYDCISCESETPHEYQERMQLCSHPHQGRQIWTCLACGQPRFVEAETSSSSSEPERSVGPTDQTLAEIHAADPEPHEIEFDAQLTAYRDRHGHFPWDD